MADSTESMVKLRLLGFNTTRTRKSSISAIRGIFVSHPTVSASKTNPELELGDIVLAASKKAKAQHWDCPESSDSEGQPAADAKARQAEKVPDTDLRRLQRALGMFTARLSA
jgi:hypothetical protein